MKVEGWVEGWGGRGEEGITRTLELDPVGDARRGGVSLSGDRAISQQFGRSKQRAWVVRHAKGGKGVEEPAGRWLVGGQRREEMGPPSQPMQCSGKGWSKTANAEPSPGVSDGEKKYPRRG